MTEVKISMFLGILGVPLEIFRANCTLMVNVTPIILKDTERIRDIPTENTDLNTKIK